MISLIAAFFLFSGAKTTEIDVGPLRLTDVSAVLTLLPLLVSHFYFELLSNVVNYARYSVAVDQLMKGLYPEVAENELQALLEPGTLQIWGGEELRDRPETGNQRAWIPLARFSP